MIKAEAVSMQINIALFAAADRGCEPLAKKLLAAGGSVLARDRRGAMPLTHAARGGHPRLAHTDPNSPVKPDVGPSVAKLVGAAQQAGQPLANAAAGLGTHLDITC